MSDIEAQNEPTDPADLSEGDRVRVVHDDQDDITGNVTGRKIEWGRYGVTLEVTGEDNPSYLMEGHRSTVTCWQRSGREFYRLDRAKPDPHWLFRARLAHERLSDDGDGEPEIITDGGTVEEEPPGHIGSPEYTPRNVYREWNPEEWDPDPDPDRFEAGEVNIWDPINGEGYNEPGHWADRDPDMSETHARRLALRGEFDGLGEDQPLPLLSSNMRGVPTEGVQGSYSNVIQLGEPCPECTGEWGVHACHSTMGGVHSERCLLCGHTIARH